MNKKELKKIEDTIKLHKHNKCKLSIIEFEIEDIQDEIDSFGADEKLNKELVRLNKFKRELSRELNRIDAALATLSDFQKELVKLRYFDKKNWESIGNLMNMNYNHLSNVIRYDALENIAQCISI